MNSELLQTIVVSVITNGTVLALFIWVFKTAFDKALDKRAKLYERELELQHKKSFHQFSKIYDEQAAAIREIYKQLVALNDAAASIAYHYNLYEQHPELLERHRMPQNGGSAEWNRYLKNVVSDQPEELDAQELAKAAARALKEFRPNRIYLPPATADEVERLLKLFIFVGSRFKDVNSRDPKTLEQIIAPQVIDTWKGVLSASQQLFPQLESQFREHLVSP